MVNLPPLGFSFEALETNFVALKSIFEALETIFDVGFEFFCVFRLGLAGNEESRWRWFGRKWWVMGWVSRH
jgi:hypothetical protein